MRLILAVAACLVLAPAHAINKCVDAGGKVTISDTPCKSADSSEQLKVFAPNAGAPPPQPAKQALVGGGEAAHQPLPLDPSARQKLFEIEAETEFTAMQGRDCKISIKVGRVDAHSCDTFRQHVNYGGKLREATAEFKRLIDSGEVTAEQMPPLTASQIQRNMDEISETTAFINTYAKSR